MRAVANMVAVGGALLAMTGSAVGLATIVETPGTAPANAQVEGYSPNALATLTPGEYYLQHQIHSGSGPEVCTLTPEKFTPITNDTVTVSIPGSGLDQVCAETGTGKPHSDTIIINSSGTITQLQGPVLLS